ncbi:N-acetylmuramoyl-L-alanine amidase [Parabacteroides sp. AM08-6]|uniref:N-acetylmuramoyl-L-alanine amidase family protein n=1 Tax=Parabacteroides sp. AM08-6 TaxID=2292053 RepID=UPI000F00830E|nr:N-acetylmuramoyl-L-alanine amidase [Parabacteroides sp. AM08-6]RHJ87700.1 N-acetylmuramoyl-L-alanine amidase [Parabacteroides sp. AM08-6]
MRIKIGIIFIFFFTLLYASDLQAQEKAFPKQGEGITLFLKRHNRSGAEYQKQFIQLNKTRLGKGNTLQMGVKYTLPPLKGKETVTPKQNNYEPLFGKQLAQYKVESNELKGTCFYLVSGHGGPDPGAIGRIGNVELHEDEYAYDIILRLARNLLTKGAKVHIIIQDAKDGIRNDRYLSNSKRETCMGSPIPFNQVRRLQQRCDKINSLFTKDRELYKRAIFVHVDSRSKSHQTDVFFYHSEKSSESKHLAKTMKSTFTHKYKKHQPGRGFSGTVDGRDLYVLRNTTPPSVFVELGNIQNTFDQQRIILSDNRQALANWLCEGFITDYNRYKKKIK